MQQHGGVWVCDGRVFNTSARFHGKSGFHSLYLLKHFGRVAAVRVCVCDGNTTWQVIAELCSLPGCMAGRVMFILAFSDPEVIPLKHYGKREVLGKIGNMEAKYNESMHFDPDLLPTTSRASGDKLQCGLWNYSVAVVGKPKKSTGKQTLTLEAAQYGFQGGEELLAVKQYLYYHGKFRLVAVSLISLAVLG